MNNPQGSETRYAGDQNQDRPGDPVGARESRYVASRLKLYFAMLSCLGGLVLGAGEETESIPVIAVFFAVFGYIFVDWLELFALPPIAAYAAMAVAALYCVSDFANLDAPGNRQMVAVAELLVFVQAILMLQKKSRRIFEQLGVFCLLQLIVAAVFNNAINYGLLLIPISIIGAWALSLLSAVAAWEGLQEFDDLGGNGNAIDAKKSSPDVITVSAPDSVRSLSQSASRLPRIALFAMAPSVLLVGVIFFYALPRRTDAARMTGRGNALVGFSDQLQIGQIGRMMQSSEPALRIHAQDSTRSLPYTIVGGLYLRGRVLERYQVNLNNTQAAGVWTALPLGVISGSQRLPAEYFPPRRNDQNFYDSVNFQITCESMRSPSLFAIAPYHRRGKTSDLYHAVGRWTISRSEEESWVYPRLSYSFGSNAFRSGIQNDLIARYAESDVAVTLSSRSSERRERSYRAELLEYDIDLIPSAESLASEIAGLVPEDKRNHYAVAKAFEEYLAARGGFTYTLNLNAETVPGLDPLEQFLSIDRRGHCQYFASSLVMMLRSQGIPARIVVGYRTEEYNELGQYYVARQLHAHAWVEALLDRDQLPSQRVIYGQPDNEQYWLRLDPTPGGGGVGLSGAGGVRQVFDLAQNIWDDYVVEMDSSRQNAAMLNTPGMTPMSDSYTNLIRALTDRLTQIRAGQLGGGSLASRKLFSWPAAVIGVFLTLFVFVLFRLKTPVWIRRKLRRKMAEKAAVPTVPFYAKTLHLLARVGVERRATQTPAELACDAEQTLNHPMIPSIGGPLGILTSAYYRTRFGKSERADKNSPDASDTDVAQALAELTQSVDLIETSSNGERR